MDISQNIIPALVLTTIAGLSTGIGSAIAYFIRKPKVIYLAFSLGLSAGVMIYISFMQLLPGAAETVGQGRAVAAFFVGIAFIGLIDMLIPEEENPHHYEGLDDTTAERMKGPLMRTGLLTALAIAIHNFPEGLATFVTTLGDIRLGLFTAMAIAIHNVPEGISVSVPILYATGNKNKAFAYSFLSGMAEPAGACLGFLIFHRFLSEHLVAALSAFVAGIMVYISVDVLLPMAHRYGRGHVVIIGIVLGMLIMALSLLML